MPEYFRQQQRVPDIRRRDIASLGSGAPGHPGRAATGLLRRGDCPGRSGLARDRGAEPPGPRRASMTPTRPSTPIPAPGVCRLKLVQPHGVCHHNAQRQVPVLPGGDRLESKVDPSRPEGTAARGAVGLTTDDNSIRWWVNPGGSSDRRRLTPPDYLSVRTTQFSQARGPVTSLTGTGGKGKQVSYVRNSSRHRGRLTTETVTLFQFDRDAWCCDLMRAFPGTAVVSKIRFLTSCVPTFIRSDLRSNVACWPSIMSTNRESSSPPTPSGRCPATRPTTLTPLNRRSTPSSATSRAPSRPFRLASAMAGYKFREFLLRVHLGALGSGELRQADRVGVTHR